MDPSETTVRRAIRIRGVVQGVGFRPSIYRLALSLGLAGFVRNERGSVWIEVEGSSEQISSFLSGIPEVLPGPARIDSLETSTLPPRGEDRFVIDECVDAEGGDRGAPCIPADLAPCEACILELEDAGDRRFRYPFINCTACGPRYTIVRSVPYERERTTMSAFPLCADCRREYDDPADRRFHAEANSCPSCGPRLSFHRADDSGRGWSTPLSGDAIRAAADALLAGDIVAIKGAGGFALACDATNEEAVARLRSRKHRPHKALAVMGRSLWELERITLLSDRERRALLSPARPIVLARRRPDAEVASGIAPGLVELGVFLPPTPLQLLLLREGPALQVMTSGNRAGEPIAIADREAFATLAGVADAILTHDREIHARADDSVVRLIGGECVSIRRARGFVPEVYELPEAGPPLLAVGAGEKNTVCVAAEGKAVLSPHLGDLHHPDAFQSFRDSIERLSKLRGIEPRAVAHDLHPDFRSTRWAMETGLPLVAVQHHHAHVAACLVEAGAKGPVLGVAFDGTGLGLDGSLWGGELLLADLRSSFRLAHLRAISLAGGEAAIRQPWRLAVAALLDAGEDPSLLGPIDAAALRHVRTLLQDSRSVRSTGAGRWFDAVASLCGLRHEITYDGQAAAELEAAASPCAEQPPFPFELVREHGTWPVEVDLRPMVRELAAELRRGSGVDQLAARFHATLANVVLEICREARASGAPPNVALTGGCFQNRRLGEETAALLLGDGFEVVRCVRIPPNDGGIALGQAAIASSQLAAAEREGSVDVSRDTR